MKFLKELLDYDPETGIFRWKVKKGPRAMPGQVAGSPFGKQGYVIVNIDGKHYRAHRLAWWYVYGKEPIGVIDHINHVRSDNRIANLQDIPEKENRLKRLYNNKASFRLSNYSCPKRAYEAYCSAARMKFGAMAVVSGSD